MEKPTYYGSWKGRVIKSIAIDGAITWEDIREYTGLNPKQLNGVLKELFTVGVLEKSDKYPYRVQYDMYKTYKAYYDQQETKQIPKTRVKEGAQVEIKAFVTSWLELKNLNKNMDKQHFYLQGRYLDELSKDIIEKGKSEVLIVNPYVRETDLARSLLVPAKNEASVTLITRPENKDLDFHEGLKSKGIHLVHHDTVHAKLIVVDRAVAFVSSMNFIPTSSAGQSWEAGIVTFEDDVISDILNSIYQLQE